MVFAELPLLCFAPIPGRTMSQDSGIEVGACPRTEHHIPALLNLFFLFPSRMIVTKYDLAMNQWLYKYGCKNNNFCLICQTKTKGFVINSNSFLGNGAFCNLTGLFFIRFCAMK